MTEQRMARCPHVDPQRGQCVYADGHSCECLPEALAYAAPASAPQKLRRAALELRGAVLDALDRRMRPALLRVESALQRARRWWR